MPMAKTHDDDPKARVAEKPKAHSASDQRWISLLREIAAHGDEHGDRDLPYMVKVRAALDELDPPPDEPKP